jgi:putative PEP-CTERM system histidine kinase
MQLATSRSSEELQQRILSAYCEVFGMTGAALFLQHDSCGGYSMTAGYQMKPIEEVIQRGNSLIRFMKERGWVVCIKDKNPEMLPENERFFAANRISYIVPIFDGENIEGFIALGPVIKEDELYIYEDYDLMKTIARQASLAFLYQKMSEQVTEAREIEVIGNVATFVAHDLKNQVSNLSLILENAARHISNPEFQQDMLVSLGNTVGKMQNLIGSLKNLGDKELYAPQMVNLLGLVHRTASLFAGSRIVVSGKDQLVNVDEGEIQKVVMNLIMNAIEASGPDQPVAIEVGAADRIPYITVTDRGAGMSSSFIRTELFKPFRTSKTQGLGIGLYQSRKILEAHGGRFEVSSAPGSGTVFTVWLTDSAAHQGPPSVRTGQSFPGESYSNPG